MCGDERAYASRILGGNEGGFENWDEVEKSCLTGAEGEGQRHIGNSNDLRISDQGKRRLPGHRESPAERTRRPNWTTRCLTFASPLPY